MDVIAIFDVGKTNKKIFLFDRQYNIVFEKSFAIEETTDEEGDACEDIYLLRAFLFAAMDEVLAMKGFTVKAINYSAYGASFVYVDEKGKELTPLYNYLKKYPEALQKNFYGKYGGEEIFAHRTASPVLGSLNSGLQLYRIKHQKPGVFKRIHAALHLPQYLSWLFTHQAFSDMTSIGSHTALWDFSRNDYHEWVYEEGIKEKLPPLHSHADVVNIIYKNKALVSGIGLHDSSAALIPYLVSFREPFVLISSGTWNITLSPFNQSPLSTTELQQDCLCYFSFTGKPIKASRLFAGYEHAAGIKKLASWFKKPVDFYEQVNFDASLIMGKTEETISPGISDFENYEKAYHHLMMQLVKKQVASSNLVMTKDIKHIFVDGGFSKNIIFMELLAAMYPGKQVYAASISQSTALGAALAIHHAWNDLPLSQNMIMLKPYTPGLEITQF